MRGPYRRARPPLPPPSRGKAAHRAQPWQPRPKTGSAEPPPRTPRPACRPPAAMTEPAEPALSMRPANRCGQAAFFASRKSAASRPPAHPAGAAPRRLRLSPPTQPGYKARMHCTCTTCVHSQLLTTSCALHVCSYLQSSVSTWWTVHSCWNMQLYRALDWRSLSTRYEN